MRAHLDRLLTPLALATLAALAAWPVLRQGPPTVGDGFNHFFRLAELHWAVQNGQLYPRWLPDVAYGFGLPVFNFYPPLSYWLAETWALLGATLPAALQAGYLLACLALVTGTYVWARDVYDSPLAGLGAAAAASTAPYLFLNLVHRAAYPETWGLAWAPWLFWAALRLSRGPGPARAGVLAVAAAAVVLSHALSALMLLPLAFIYLAALIRADRRAWAWAALGWLLAAGLSATFWLPVLREARFIQLSRVGGGTLDYRAGFLTLGDLLGPPRAFDPLRTFDEVSPGLNWVAIALGGLGLWSRRGNRSVRLAGAGALFLAGLTLPLSEPLWRALPLLRFVQFPWRWVGPLSLLLALLAGGGLAAVADRIAHPAIRDHVSRITQHALLPLFTLAAALFSLTWTFGDAPANLTGVDHADIPAFELESGQFGTTAMGEYLSVWAAELPDPGVFSAAYADRQLPAPRLDRASLPPAASLLRETPGFDRTVVEYESPHGFDARLNWLFFPDVVAEAAGAQLLVGPEPETGLVHISALPAGRHTLTVHRVLSEPQRQGTVVSAISLALSLSLASVPILRARSKGGNRKVSASRIPALGTACTAGAILLARVLWLDVRPSIFHRTRLQGQVVAGAEPRDVNFGGMLDLIGVQVEGQSVRLFWRPLANLGTDYSVALFLQDEAGYVYGQQDSQHPGPVPTSHWQRSQYALDEHELQPLPGTPPGEYRLVVGVYSANGNLDVETATGPAGYYTSVGTMHVPPAARQPTLLDLAPQTVSGERFGDFILLGYDVDRPAVVAGDAFYVTLYWQAQVAASPDTLAELNLRRADRTLARTVAPLTNRRAPWKAGEVGRDPHAVAVPNDTPPGAATIVLQVGGRELELGGIEVTR